MKYIFVSSTILVLLTIASGIIMTYGDHETSKPKLKKVLKFNYFTFIPLMLIALIVLIPDIVLAFGEGQSDPSGLGYLAAALCTGIATLGAGYAVGSVGSSALGAVSEDPKILGKTLIFVGLAEGIAIYGLIISILILGKL